MSIRRPALAIALVALIAAVMPATVPGLAAGTTLTVDTFEDTYDGSCDDGDCSLRDAIGSAPAGATVFLPGGVYALTTTEAGGVGDGAVEIAEALTIAGDEETGTFVDGSLLGSTMFRVVGGTVTIQDLTMLGATTDDLAGAIWVSGAVARLRHVTIAGGVAEDAGGVYVGAGAEIGVTASLFLANRSRGDGGAIRAAGGTIRSVRSSAFVDNVADRGGAIAGHMAEMENTTLQGNLAHARGGALRLSGIGELRSVTIAGNRAPRAAAISVAAGARVFAINLLVARNRSETGPQCDRATASLGGNLEDGRSCGFDRRSDQPRTAPMLAPLASYGGPTPTMALRTGSPAIDGGLGCRGVDQRGAPREGPCDAGAYERVLCGGRPVDIVGTPGNDDLSGGREPDTFLGLGGDDVFQGSLADDIACGGRGDDVLRGGPEDDVLRGGPGADRLFGEDGDDRCIGGPGADRYGGCERRR